MYLFYVLFSINTATATTIYYINKNFIICINNTQSPSILQILDEVLDYLNSEKVTAGNNSN